MISSIGCTTCRYLTQCWPKYALPNCVTTPQCAKLISKRLTMCQQKKPQQRHGRFLWDERSVTHLCGFCILYLNTAICQGTYSAMCRKQLNIFTSVTVFIEVECQGKKNIALRHTLIIITGKLFYNLESTIVLIGLLHLTKSPLKLERARIITWTSNLKCKVLITHLYYKLHVPKRVISS